MNKLKKPELLCPVGGKLQLIAAVENGADAVYLGGAEFNARMYADNFNDLEFLEEAVDYCHLRSVKVYVALNTLLNDREMDRAVAYAKDLYKIGVDAVIVQDLGLVGRLSKEVPNLKIHISTQATVYSKEGVEFFNNQNIDRAVLARELSLDEIKEIAENVDKEIEVFIHGALCVCYSGQCKLSSVIGSRSGNRGKCAQPCRLPYRLVELGSEKETKEDYYLSTKDICTIDILPKIIEAGVSSLKIEGRMKSPEYVAAVTRIYRKYIDMYFENAEYFVDDSDKNELLQVFNRGGFYTGYLEGKNSNKLWCNIRPKHWGTYLGKVLEYNEKKNNIKIKLEENIQIGDGIEIVNNLLSGCIISFIRRGKDRVSEARKGDIVVLGDIKGKICEGQDVYKITSKKLNNELKEYFSGKSIKKNNVKLEVIMKIGKKINVNVSCNILGKEFSAHIEDGIECEKGLNRCLSKEEIKKQFAKTGDVPFKVDNIDIELEDNLITPISNINYIRRKLFEILSNKIVESFKHKKIECLGEKINNEKLINDRKVKTKLSGYVYDYNLLDSIIYLNELDRVYFSLEDVACYKDEILSKIDKEKLYIYLPTITTSKYKKFIYKNMTVIKEINNLVITNVEHLKIFENMNLNIVIDNSFNVFNSDSLNSIFKYNIDTVNLSNELTLEQINNIKVIDNKNIEVDMYGNMQVMYSNFCVVGASVSKKEECKMCIKSKYFLKDRKNKIYPIIYNNIDCNIRILNSDKLFSLNAIENLNGKVDYMRLYLYDEKEAERGKIILTLKDALEGKSKNRSNNLELNNKYTSGHFFNEI